jgi:AraC-like DNA-binding protein
MRTIQSAAPSCKLREFVRSYAQREINCTDIHLVQTSIASLEQILAFNFCDQPMLRDPAGHTKLVPRIHVVGSQTHPSGEAIFSGQVVAFGVFFEPYALWRLFRIPSSILVDHDYDGCDVFGKSVRDLWQILAESKSFADRIRVVEDFLFGFVANASPPTPVLTSVRYMLRLKGVIRVDELANHSALSIRHYERRFAEEVGMSPKHFARTSRFQLALDAKRASPHHTWLWIAHEFGYFDQMHLVRDFKSLGGQIPSDLSGKIGDLRPWSLASSAVYEFPENAGRTAHRK